MTPLLRCLLDTGGIMGVPLFGEDHEDHPACRHEHSEPALQPYIFVQIDGAEEGGEARGQRLAYLRRAQADGQCARVLAGVAYDDPEHPGGRRQPKQMQRRKPQVARNQAKDAEHHACQRLPDEHDRRYPHHP